MKIKLIPILLIMLSLFSCVNKSKSIKFDQHKWKTGTQIERGNMSTDLVESKMLIGKNNKNTYANVRNLKPHQNSWSTIWKYANPEYRDYGYAVIAPFAFLLIGINFNKLQ